MSSVTKVIVYLKFKMELSGRSKGVPGTHAPLLGPNSSFLMQFSAKNLQTNSWHMPSWVGALYGNRGSTTGSVAVLARHSIMYITVLFWKKINENLSNLSIFLFCQVIPAILKYIKSRM